MKEVSILIPEMADASTIVGTYEMFTAVNEFYKSSGHRPFFNVQTVGLTKEVKLKSGMVVFHPDKLLNDAGRADLIVIPSLCGDIKLALKQNNKFIPWIINQYTHRAEIASLCVGSFLLAETGLLKDKYCSTHWLFANEFRAMFPDIRLVDDRVITDQNGLYSSGGANVFWNLLLYLVEKNTNRDMAICASKYFLIDIEKDSQLPFTAFRGQQKHGDQVVLAAQNHIEKHFQNKFNVAQLAKTFKLERRTFERRFKRATANTVMEYVQRVKIEMAKKRLETGIKTINEIMFEVGYNDSTAFRKVFMKYSGLSPVSYRKKFI